LNSCFYEAVTLPFYDVLPSILSFIVHGAAYSDVFSVLLLADLAAVPIALPSILGALCLCLDCPLWSCPY
jgi:hypothetical protein